MKIIFTDKTEESDLLLKKKNSKIFSTNVEFSTINIIKCLLSSFKY